MQPFRMKRPSQQVQAEIKFLFKRKASPVMGLKVKSRLQLICMSFWRAFWSGYHSFTLEPSFLGGWGVEFSFLD